MWEDGCEKNYSLFLQTKPILFDVLLDILNSLYNCLFIFVIFVQGGTFSPRVVVFHAALFGNNNMQQQSWIQTHNSNKQKTQKKISLYKFFGILVY